MCDLLILNGSLLDGTGAPPLRADLAITGNRIHAIGHLSGRSARCRLDAAGAIVCPGFIDAHSHSDAFILVDPRAVSKISQGITTEICGNCGSSAAPRTSKNRLPADWESHSFPGEWKSVAEYRRLLEQVQPAVNILLLAGHNTLRAGLIGYENRPASPEELRTLERHLDTALAEGAGGFSTGLIYPPGLFAPADEIQCLAAIAARRGGIYTSHMRSEGARLLESLTETLAVCRATGIPTQISHLKTSGRPNWPLIQPALDLIRSARREGLPVAADRYPYTASCTDLDVIFPAWAEEGGRTAILERIRNPVIREKIRIELLAARTEDAWGSITLGSITHPDLKQFRGQPLPAVAEALKLAPVDTVLSILDRDELRTSAFFHGMSEINLITILAEPYVMIGSDASLRAPDGPLSHDYPHPRAYGSFPRFLRMVLDGRSVSLPDAIRKMTALPADHFGLADRGRLSPGLAADVVIIDPLTVRDNATFAEPQALSQGIRSVIVNGTLTWHENRMTGNRAGRFVTPDRAFARRG
jgi:N-acyl-D-amino-acid deacylase